MLSVTLFSVGIRPKKPKINVRLAYDRSAKYNVKSMQEKYYVALVFHFISLTLFSVILTNSYSKITNKYQPKQKIYKIRINFKIKINI